MALPAERRTRAPRTSELLPKRLLMPMRGRRWITYYLPRSRCSLVLLFPRPFRLVRRPLRPPRFCRARAPQWCWERRALWGALPPLRLFRFRLSLRALRPPPLRWRLRLFRPPRFCRARAPRWCWERRALWGALPPLRRLGMRCLLFCPLGLTLPARHLPQGGGFFSSFLLVQPAFQSSLCSVVSRLSQSTMRGTDLRPDFQSWRSTRSPSKVKP